jgi:hypothetical protein
MQADARPWFRRAVVLGKDFHPRELEEQRLSFCLDEMQALEDGKSQRVPQMQDLASFCPEP